MFSYLCYKGLNEKENVDFLTLIIVKPGKIKNFQSWQNDNNNNNNKLP